MNESNIGATISVITPCLNGARYIGEAIESVMGQRYPHFEHIVVDGGSTDGTLEILARYPHLTVIKGPDAGVYDALNKGIAAAHGEIIGFLNSDDCYAEDIFYAVDDGLARPDAVALAGDALSFKGTVGARADEVSQFTGAAADLLHQSTLGNPYINAWFFKVSVFASIGHFDASYRVAGDREFMLRLACSALSCVHLARLVYRYRIHPASMTFTGNTEIWETVAREHDKMTDDYLRRRDISKRARILIKQTRTRDTLRMAVRSARRHEWRQFMRHAAAGTRYDRAWPLRLARRALGAFIHWRPRAPRPVV